MRRRSPSARASLPAPRPAALRPPPPDPARWLPFALLGALLPPLLGALLASCGEEDAAAPPPPDAGMACERGTLGCACAEGNACFGALLCSSGRCLPTEGSRDREPELRVPVQPPCSAQPCDTGPASSN